MIRLLFSDFEILASMVSSLSVTDMAEPENISIIQDLRSSILLVIEGAQSNPSTFPSDWVSGVRNWSIVV